jgi:putative Mg2+ transporter-C (MgtC) family protein
VYAEPTLLEEVLRLLVALVLGGVLGLERETKDKPAGLRTLSLVAAGSAGFTLVGLAMIRAIPGAAEASADPTRLVAGLAGGVGFLGAGAIIQSRASVKGLTTATTVWVAAAIGLASGCGRYTIAAALALLAVLVLRALAVVERRHLD